MRKLKSIFQFYIHSSIHVALAVVAFAVLRMKEMGLDLEFNFLFFMFLASVSGYNFVKFAGIAKLYHRRLTRQLKGIQLFSAAAFLLMLYFLFQLNLKSILLLIGLSLINFVYAFPVFTNRKNLRNLSGVKIFIIALVWASSCVLLPSLEFRITLNTFTIWQFVQQILMILTLMIPFEIRDFKYDDQNLFTLPQILGIWKTKFLGSAILVLILLIPIFNHEISLLFTIPFSVLLFLLILFASKNQHAYYASFFVEVIPILSLLFYYLF
jgi:hypothetical protein